MKKFITQIIIGVLITVISAGIIGGVILYTSYHTHLIDYQNLKQKTTKDNSALNNNFEKLEKQFALKNRGINHRIDQIIDNTNKHFNNLNGQINNLTFVIKENNKIMKKQLELLNDKPIEYSSTSPTVLK